MPLVVKLEVPRLDEEAPVGLVAEVALANEYEPAVARCMRPSDPWCSLRETAVGAPTSPAVARPTRIHSRFTGSRFWFYGAVPSRANGPPPSGSRAPSSLSLPVLVGECAGGDRVRGQPDERRKVIYLPRRGSGVAPCDAVLALIPRMKDRYAPFFGARSVLAPTRSAVDREALCGDVFAVRLCSARRLVGTTRRVNTKLKQPGFAAAVDGRRRFYRP